RTCSLTYTALAKGHRFRPITAFSIQRRVRASTCSVSRSGCMGSVTEVPELQGQAEVGPAQQGDGLLQLVAFLAVDAQLVAVDLAVHPEPGVLEHGLDLPGRLPLDALPDRGILPRRGQAGLHRAELQAADVDAARGQALAQDVVHLLDLEVAGRAQGDGVSFQHEARVHALEVEAVVQFAVGPVHGVGQLVAVHLGDDVEGG